MRQTSCLCLLLALVDVSIADPATYSVGDINQYTRSGASTPTLSGSTVVYTAAAGPNDGVDVFISPDLQASIKKATDANCQALNNQCIQSVKDVLTNPNTELDTRADPLTERFVVAASAALVGLVSVLYAYWHLEQQPPPMPIHINPAQIGQATSAVSAPTVVVVMESPTPALTITPKPEPTAVTGTIPPLMTTFTDTGVDHVRGDVMISLSPNLARRMDEIVRRTSTCPAGYNFAHGAGSKLRTRADDLAGAICGAQSIVANAAPGAAFADVLVLRPPVLPWTGADALRAMNVVVQFARDYASALQLDLIAAGLVGVAAFAIAWLVLVNNVALAAENRIPAASLSGTISSLSLSSSTSSSTGCTMTDAARCTINCGMIGAIERCDTACNTPTQTSCSVSATTTVRGQITPWAVPDHPDFTAPAPSQSLPTPDCKEDDVSGLPYNVFDGAYGQFCAEVGKSSAAVLLWLVGSDGNRIPQAARALDERTPPPNPSTYADYRIGLAWAPGDANTACVLNCTGAYNLLSTSPCGHASDEMDIMTTNAKVGVGCGEYSYNIKAPAAPAKPQPPPPRPLISQICAAHQGNATFTRDDALDAIRPFCDWVPGMYIPTRGTGAITRARTGPGVTVYTSYSWSGDQTGCNAMQSMFKIEVADCIAHFIAAMDNCDTDTTTAKYGSTPLTWNSPKGCIDFALYGIPKK